MNVSTFPMRLRSWQSMYEQVQRPCFHGRLIHDSMTLCQIMADSKNNGSFPWATPQCCISMYKCQESCARQPQIMWLNPEMFLILFLAWTSVLYGILVACYWGIVWKTMPFTFGSSGIVQKLFDHYHPWSIYPLVPHPHPISSLNKNEE